VHTGVVPTHAVLLLALHWTHVFTLQTNVPGLLAQCELPVHSTHVLLLHTGPFGLVVQSAVPAHSTHVCAEEQTGFPEVFAQSVGELHSTPPHEPSDWHAFMLPHRSLLMLHATQVLLPLQMGVTPLQFAFVVQRTHWLPEQ
jgi:hypothetical protein